jgi:hypothetical protein
VQNLGRKVFFEPEYTEELGCLGVVPQNMACLEE